MFQGEIFGGRPGWDAEESVPRVLNRWMIFEIVEGEQHTIEAISLCVKDWVLERPMIIECTSMEVLLPGMLG